MSEREILLAVFDAPGGDRYLATEYYATQPGDTPANVLFDARLVTITHERAVAFVVWSRSGGASPVSTIDIINTDNALIAWLDESWRDRPVTFKTVRQRAAYSTAITVGRVINERIDAASIHRLRFICRSTLERLRKPITTSYSVGINNIQVRGQPRPLALGLIRFAGPIATRLNNGSIRGLYELTDAPFEGIVMLLSRGAAQTEYSSPLLATGGYFVDAQDVFGFHYGPQLYRLAAEVRGNVRREANIVANPTFPTGTGGNPDGWTRTTAGGSDIQWLAAGNVELTGDNDTCRLTQSVTVVNGARYQIEVTLETVNAVASIYAGAPIRDLSDITSGPRTVAAVFVASGTTAQVGVEIPVSSTGKVYVSAIRVYRIHRIDSLAEVMRFVAGRVGLSESDFDLTAAAAIDTASGYSLAWYSTQEVTGESLLRAACNSFGVACFESLSGKLTPVRLAAPAVSADIEIGEWQIADIGRETDLAEGLSGRMNYGRNYVVHTDDDMAGTSDAGLRAELAREYATVTTTVSLHPMYADAMQREPLDSMLSVQAHAQAEIDRLCGLYTVPRAFYTVRVLIDQLSAAATIEPGATVRVTHPKLALASGKNLRCVLARREFGRMWIEWVLWG